MPAPGSAGGPTGPLALAVVLGRPETTPFALAVDGVLVAAAATYAVGSLRRRPGRGPVPGRAACFLLGLLVVYVAVGSGLAAYSARPSVVVVQHVLLMMAAPPLLVLGRPKAPWAPRSRPPARAPHAPRLRGVTVWAAYYGSMAAFFLTPLFPRSLGDPALLDGSEVWFGAVGLAFSASIVGGTSASGQPRYWARIAAILAGAPVETAVGLALLLWPHPLGPGVGVATTHIAGLVLWSGGMFTSGLSLAYVLGLWCVDDTRRGADLDALLDAAAAPVSLGGVPGSGRPGRG